MAIPVIGEWVENQKTKDMLTRLGVNYGQGFYIQKPSLVVVQETNQTIKSDNLLADPYIKVS
jgi:EAL domain-containing protein (putative c-di-GMP-specific phosphodiesterase class I)